MLASDPVEGPGYRAGIDGDDHDQLRRRPTPERRVDGQVVVARVHEDAALVLAPTAAAVWDDLGAWRSVGELVEGLGARWPDVDEAARVAAVAEVVELLDREDLVERRRP